MNDYHDFLQSKLRLARPYGFTVAREALHTRHKPFQRDIISWALERGRAAIFANTGLGKTGMQLEWARQVQAHTGRPVLILAPLAVAAQTITEARQLALHVGYVRNQHEAMQADTPIVISNYDRLKDFSGDAWAGVVLDESSVLKGYTSKTKQLLEATFEATPYKLACTATPSPNDHIELGNHAQFLGVMPSNEMLARFFINDSMKAGGYRLRYHGQRDFWRWIVSWAACVVTPADLGYNDPGYDLPPLHIESHTVAVDHTRAWSSGQMFVTDKQSATGMWREKKETMNDRVARAVDVVNAEPDESWLVWVSTDSESKAMTQALPGAVEVKGSQKPEVKEERLLGFSRGDYRILVTKPSIAGFGLNWQHCARQLFVSPSYSFEEFYQALKRSHRYGQTREVYAHVVAAETEGSIKAALDRKAEQYREMQQQMIVMQRETGLLAGRDLRLALYDAPTAMQLPSWFKEAV